MFFYQLFWWHFFSSVVSEALHNAIHHPVSPTKSVISDIHICFVLFYEFSKLMLMMTSPVSHPGWVIISFESMWPKINALNFFHSFPSPPSLLQLITLDSNTWRLCFAHLHQRTMRCPLAAPFSSSTFPQFTSFSSPCSISPIQVQNILQWLLSPFYFLLFQMHPSLIPL